MKIAALLVAAGLAATANAQISLVANNSRTWVDISTTGTSVGTIGDDTEHDITSAALSAAGFTGNNLFGLTTIRVGNNGGVLWGGSAAATEVGYTNADLLTGANSNSTSGGNGNGVRQFVAVIQDDNFPGAGGSVNWQVINGTLIIQWTNEDHFSAQGTGTVTYQLQVYSGTNGGAFATFLYQDLNYSTGASQNFGGSATIGYRANGFVPADPSLTNSVQWALPNTPNQVMGFLDGAGTAAQPNAIDIVPTPGAVALLGLGGLAASRRRR